MTVTPRPPRRLREDRAVPAYRSVLPGFAQLAEEGGDETLTVDPA